MHTEMQSDVGVHKEMDTETTNSIWQKQFLNHDSV